MYKNTYEIFHKTLTTVYTLNKAPNYKVQRPIFDNFWFDTEFNDTTIVSNADDEDVNSSLTNQIVSPVVVNSISNTYTSVDISEEV